VDPGALFDMAVLALLCGIIGGRAWYVLHNWEAAFKGRALINVLRIDQGGLAFFGGLIGGIAAVVWKMDRAKMPPLPTLDVAASVVPLAHAFGRVGCLLAGCCFGRPTTSWVGISFPQGSDAFQHQNMRGLLDAGAAKSLAVHPTQLYDCGMNLILFGLLSWLLWKRRRPGDVTWVYLIFAGLSRFIVEFFRADTARWIGPFDIFHFTYGALAVCGVVLLLRSRREEPIPLPEPWQPVETDTENKA
jgi:phosphatidylglycerol---prolipoprotein diacylglyceryl transferase